MRRLPVAVLALAALAALPAATAASQGPGYRVVVHPQNTTPSLSRSELTRLFMKKITAWPDGKTVVPVDQERVAPVRQAFSSAVHMKDSDAVAAHWQVLVFSGRDTPPRTLRSDDEVVAFVRENPGAVGYVSEGASLAGVRVVPTSK
ncbi:MAG: phosphate ABC transporter substrate-binding protein [Vicinamibacteria bacterium]|nr:phosphate ABC transporter substrate-binding protein [Vicinamibacteria bacterium]